MTLRPWICSGLLFLALCRQPAGATGLELARELAAEGDWQACLVECRRVEAYDPTLQSAARALRASVETQEGRARPSKPWWKQLGALPVKALVGFYRNAVAPALGARCSLEPSCSAYSLQAARERGWLSIPMTADRLIREPTVVAAQEKPLPVVQGRRRFADPVADHIGRRQHRHE